MSECKHSIGPHVDAIGLALGNQSVLQVTPLPSTHYKTQLRVVSFMSLVGDGGYLWQKVLYNALTLVYMAVYNLVIKLIESFQICFDLFVFLVKISRLLSFK